jgi:hypothetical protein
MERRIEKGIKISRNTEIKTICFRGRPNYIGGFKWCNIHVYINLTQLFPNMDKILQHKKEKTMPFNGRGSVVSKITINNNIMEEINTLNYVCCTIA